MGELLGDWDLTISIVTYKTDSRELEQAIACCQRSVLRTSIAIIDNSPSQQLASVCHALGVSYHQTQKNVGFGAAHNIAFRNSRPSNYHLVLNPDVQFKPGVLEELVSFLDLNRSVGLVMPRVTYPDGTPQRLCKRLPTPFDILGRRLLPRLLKRALKHQLARFELQDRDMNSLLLVPYLSGCFMLIRKQALLDVGGFDERFVMYFEDLDLTRRIRARSRTVYYPLKTITHRHQRGSYNSVRLLFQGIRSAVRYFNKWGWFKDQDRALINSTIGSLSGLRLPPGARLQADTSMVAGLVGTETRLSRSHSLDGLA